MQADARRFLKFLATDGHGFTTISVLMCVAASALTAATADRLKESRLEAVHEQRVEWMKKRGGGPLLGVYQDFRAVLTRAQASRAELAKAAREAGVEVVFAREERGRTGGVLFVPLPKGDFKGMEIYRRPEESAEEWKKLRG